ncbi:MAG: hypothetical protein Q7R35_11055 [Elusimicrobiota bacterium]|nr:hypothetical protein [Elusimicrobiota bacterium]
MNNNSEAVMQSVKCLTEFYREIGEFIRALDRVMNDAGYSVVKASKDSVVDATSGTLDRPHRWLPVCFYRGYTAGSMQYFAVNILLDRTRKEHTAVLEPLLIGCRITFASRMREKSWKDSSWDDTPRDLYFYTKPVPKVNHKVYGKKELLTTENRKALNEKYWGDDELSIIKDISLATVPLMQLTSKTEIKEMVLKLFCIS